MQNPPKRAKLADDSFLAFTEWLEEHGARFSQLSFVHSARFGNHAVAVEEISGRNGSIVTLPRAFLMSPSAALSSLTAGKALQRVSARWSETPGLPQRLCHPTACDRFCVMALLCHEAARGMASFWAPYIDLLPPPRSVPALAQMNMAQLRQLGLEGTTLGAQAEAVWEDIAAQVRSPRPKPKTDPQP